MLLKKLTLTNFMKHDSTTLDFPALGVVLITGKNGSGKSSIAEAVAWSGWGETLRKKPPYRKDVSAKAPCAATVETTSGVTVTRTRKGSATKLEWKDQPESEIEFSTTTKAQDDLDSIIGSYETWRASHVFSSSDAARFTAATDKERKLLLESLVLDGARFDTALAKCRVDSKAAQLRLSELASTKVVLTEKLNSARLRKASAERTLQALPTEAPAGDKQRLEVLKQNERVLVDEVQDMRSEVMQRKQSTGHSDGELSVLVRQLNKLGSAGHCDACGQDVPQELRASLQMRIGEKQKAIADERRAVEEEVLGYQASAKDAETRLQALRSQIATLTNELAKGPQLAHARATSQAEATAAAKAIEEIEARLERILSEVPTAEAEAALLDAAEQVLGLRGVRAAILGNTLKAIELAINGWLPRLAGHHLRVKLTASVETKGGTINDAIGFEVEGAGEGYGYLAASQGERRRIDVAVLLALADVSSAARGTPPGTLFLDEVLDALDEEGTEAVARVLEEIGRTRPVVVVSHNAELAQRLPSATKWKIEDGRVA